MGNTIQFQNKRTTALHRPGSFENFNFQDNYSRQSSQKSRLLISRLSTGEGKRSLVGPSLFFLSLVLIVLFFLVPRPEPAHVAVPVERMQTPTVEYRFIPGVDESTGI